MIYHQPRPTMGLTAHGAARGWLPRYLYPSLVFGLLCWSSFAPGSAWVSTAKYEGRQYVGTFSWETEERGGSICFDNRGCYVAICHFTTVWRQKCVNPVATSTAVVIPIGSSAIDAQRAFVKKNGTSGTWRTTSAILRDPTTCFGVMYWQGAANWNWTGELIPGSYCGTLPPANDHCELVSDVVIEYGSVAAAAVRGLSKSESLDVSCTAPTDIIITLVGGEKSISLGGGITSKLSINNSDLSSGAKITAPAGSQSFPITSTLTSSGKPVAGSYSGSGILVLGYQ